jgi:tartrate-resistant acid phosphatase type 5
LFRSAIMLTCFQVFVLAFIAVAHPQSSNPKQKKVPLPDAIINRLPQDWQATARKYETITKEQESAYGNVKDVELRSEVLVDLSFKEGPEEFVIDHLQEAISNPYLLILLHNLPKQEHWWNHSRVDSVLENLAISIPDQEIALACLDSVRKLEMQRLRQALNRRMVNPALSHSADTTAQLEQQDERWISLVNGTMLPAFLRRVPPIFSVAQGKSKIRVLAFGDYGSGGLQKDWDHQKEAAAAMREYARQHPFDLGITLGDNFYPKGMDSPDELRWKTDWEDFYGPLRIAFYASLGNHDWYDPDSPAAEILYSLHSPTWHMPSPYYTFTAGPVQFFAIDSNEISAAQSRWLQNALEASQAKWKIVYGHHPPYFAGPNGTTTDERIVKALMPILKGRADVYIAGHDHNLEHLKPVDGVNLFIAGGGGAVTYEADSASPVALFARQTNGFAVLEIEDHTATVRLVDAADKEIYKTTLRK